jgi:trk system potassium uptake protein TrkH
VVVAAFQSVTARTAGFNTVDQADLGASPKFLTIILMTIGASPGPTGGGLKTSTMAVVIVTVVCVIRNRRSTEVFGRTVPAATVRKTVSVVMAGLGLLVLSTFVMAAFEDRPFLDLFFETTSAFGTVGLSTGMTGALSAAGKLLLVATMFLGRIGPLTLVLAIGQRNPGADYEYPEESVMIG